ncbi:MAG TPA: phosphoglucosamine mutase [Nocardioidaceae bacterium]|nr:phosphoglucosamine mutase [Nocardioidaceae bacterium]
MGRLFGTDGIRGVANRDLTAGLALEVSAAAARILGPASGSRRPFAVVGRDPRASSEFLDAAVTAGLASSGVDVRRVDVLPTPGVAYLTAATDADFGVMISASHNPMPDNGIKFFARGGHKLDDDIEAAIEAAMGEAVALPIGEQVGRVTDERDPVSRYVAHLTSTMETSLSGLRVVIDCADGAASVAGPQAFIEAGAEVVAIHDAPNGLNINDGCGSTDLDPIRQAVVAERAHVGFALDGDQLLAILALGLRERGGLVGDTVVSTVMSNLGFMLAMREAGIAVVQAKVGDRYVLEEMKLDGYTLGGEQSGHIIMSDFASTGDGILSALHVAGRMASTGRGLAELAGVMRRLPQVLVNVPDVDRDRAATDPVVAEAVRQVELELGDGGRVLLRPSGTEPLVRVMVEAESADEAEACARRLADVVKAELAL